MTLTDEILNIPYVCGLFTIKIFSHFFNVVLLASIRFHRPPQIYDKFNSFLSSPIYCGGRIKKTRGAQTIVSN